MKRKQKELIFIGLLGGVFVIFTLIMVFKPELLRNSSKPQQEQQAPTVEKIDGSKAYVISQHFVKQLLKSPKTADFPFLDYSYVEKGHNTHIIRGYVDSQNSFGAIIRSNYILTLQYNGGNSADYRSWTLVDYSID